MKTTTLTLAALLAAALAGDVYLLSTDEQVQVVEPLPADAVELKTADADVLKAEIATADARGPVTCTLQTLDRPTTKDANGEWLPNPSEECFCSDGKSAGWLTKASECKGEVTVSDGKVYTRE